MNSRLESLADCCQTGEELFAVVDDRYAGWEPKAPTSSSLKIFGSSIILWIIEDGQLISVKKRVLELLSTWKEIIHTEINCLVRSFLDLKS